MAEYDTQELDRVFGSESCGSTPESRARTSNRIFVRSQHQVSFWNEGSKGRRFKAGEVLDAYGWDVLRELADHSASPVVTAGGEPLRFLTKQLEALGVDQRKTLVAAKWPQTSIDAFERNRQVPFKDLERLAQMISVEPHELGQPDQAESAHSLGVRLRSIGATHARFSSKVVLALAEAAWVIRKQHELTRLLNEPVRDLCITPDDEYGSYLTPAWRKGQQLAQDTRDRLGFDGNQRIESLTQLLEDTLGIPVIHVELPVDFAGATIANGDVRGIVINTNGKNHNVWVRRMTMAHELGHLLWDPPQRLKRLVVDRYSEVEADFVKAQDPVEQRANAFAVEFLAPRAAIRSLYLEASNARDGVIAIMEAFDIGRAAATYHIQNELHGATVKTGQIELEPDDALIAREELTVGYFKPDEVPYSRRGKFARLVAKAVREGLITDDTAAAYLRCSQAHIDDALAFIAQV